ncbi:MAG TPA: hypothetical protein VK611_21575 [Acidimicrobiales bacterium]|nr:hypothetical protein [Acidimicrobiales bacterium]
MSGKNEVLLTFAGDSSNLDKTMKNVGAGATTMGRDAKTGAGGLDRLGEAGGNTETRFLGLGAGISGVNTLMSGDLTAETAAMAMADLGDAVEHTVVPLAQQGAALLANGGKAVLSAGQHVAAAATTVASWIAMGIQAMASAAVMAAAWLISLGPIALVILAIGAVIGILVAMGVGFDDVKAVASAAWGFITNAASKAKDWLARNWPLVLAILTGPFGLAVLAIVRNWDSITGFFRGLPGKIGGFFSGLASTISSPFTSAFGAVKSLWNSTVGGFGFTTPSWVPFVGGKSFHIPSMHQGGIFPGAPGSEGLALLQAGERVSPAGAASGPTVVIYVAGSITSERDLVKVVRDELTRGGFGGAFG